jgi:membrane protein YdbS with pleckstrin-like domain
VVLPRKFLNDDEEILVELRPHWVFFARPLFTAVAAVAVVIAILVAFSSLPNWVADVLMALAAVPVFWLVGRLLRWRFYTLALTTTRVLVCRGVLGRNTVQIRLQRITEISLSQKLWERMAGKGRLIIDMQGEDDAVVLQFVRKPAIVQRVINGQINELLGCGSAGPIPDELRHLGVRGAAPEPAEDSGADTPPFGVPVVSPEEPPDVERFAAPRFPAPSSAAPRYTAPGGGTGPADIRDRLIELDDLRQRRIISEEEFATKKAELLSRI